MSVWTDEKIAQLREMWETGATAGLIATRLGITRSAVVGKAHREKLSARVNPVASNDALFERMVDVVADAPFGEPIEVEDAARQVGLWGQTARRMWREMCEAGGRQYA